MKLLYKENVIRYEVPTRWIRYDPVALADSLAEARAAVLSLKTIPYQRRWVEVLQQIELKREVAGTSRIEGAEFTERELDAAMKETPEQLETRSQKQAHAAVQTYRWIATIPGDRPINPDLICEIHRRIVTGADDDHCPPGRIRDNEQNVNFGQPRHRGAEGGDECQQAFEEFAQALQREYPNHDPILQAIAAHYHLAAMHPFLDGNGRTARALEALMLQRAGLRDTSFIAMSNYYYDEKLTYLSTLAEARQRGFDLTPFMAFALKGVASQSRRLLAAIQHEIAKELFRGLAMELFNRLESPRKRPLANRQLFILNRLLETSPMDLDQVIKATQSEYKSLRNPLRGLIRDLNHLIALRAIDANKNGNGRWHFAIRLEWPAEITETAFFRGIKDLPKAKTLSFLR